MNSIRHFRTDREDCLVGDCIEAASVPEWSTAAISQDYQPLGGRLTAAALNSITEVQSEPFSVSDAPWTFELENGDEPTRPRWRRIS